MPKPIKIIFVPVCIGSQSRFLLAFISMFFCSLLSFSQSTIHPTNLTNWDRKLDQYEQLKEYLEKGESLSTNDYSSAIHYLQEAITLAKELNEIKLEGDANLNLGIVYFYKDQPNISWTYFTEARILYDKSNSLEGLADLTFAQGRTYLLTSDYSNAILSFQESYSLEDKTQDQWGLSRALHALATVHLAKDNLEQAKEYAESAYAIKHKINDEIGMSNVLITIGTIWHELNELDKASEVYNQSLIIRRKLGTKRLMAQSILALSTLEIEKGNYSGAINGLDEVANIYLELEEKAGLVSTQITIGKAFLGLNDLEKAKKFTRQAMDLAKEIAYPEYIRDAHLLMAEILAHEGRFDQAFMHQRRYQIIHDSLFNVEKLRLFEELEIKYQAEQKASELKNLENRNSLQQKSIILMSLLLLLATAFVILSYFFLRQKNKLIKHKNKLLKIEKDLHERDNQLNHIKTKELKNALEVRGKELTTKVLAIQKTNESIEDIAGKLNNISKRMNNGNQLEKEINQIADKLENLAQIGLWEEFDKVFKSVYIGFYDRLLEKCSNLSPTEIKTAALLKMNLSTKDISSITFKSESGIKSARYRLRKKLQLNSDDSLVAYLMKL